MQFIFWSGFYVDSTNGSLQFFFFSNSVNNVPSTMCTLFSKEEASYEMNIFNICVILSIAP